MASATTMITRTVADVKCYHCGHISGQIMGLRGQPPRVGNFVPRRGYKGPQVQPGSRLRCERCNGPVFLEDATSSSAFERSSRSANALAGLDEDGRAA